MFITINTDRFYDLYQFCRCAEVGGTREEKLASSEEATDASISVHQAVELARVGTEVSFFFNLKSISRLTLCQIGAFKSR